MKVKSIRIPYLWEDIDSENDRIDVFVDSEDGFVYNVEVRTAKNVQFLMDEEKRNYSDL